MRISLPKAWRNEAGDTLIEVTMALSILSMVLISSSVIAAQAFRMGQTARERTAVSAAAQGQMESVRAFRDNSTWDNFLNGQAGGSPYNGVTNAGSSGPNCKVVPSCFHMEGDGATPTYRPKGDRIAGPVPTSFLETSVKGPTAATPNTVEVTVNYYFEGLGGGNFAGHITTTFTNLKYSAVPPPPPPGVCIGNADILMIFDTSSSMEEDWGSPGFTRLDELKIVAKQFVTNVAPSAIGNHVALVAFDKDAVIYSGFSGDSAALNGKITSMSSNKGTKYSVGLNAGRTVLTQLATPPFFSPRPTAKRVVVFVSDGQDSEVGGGGSSALDNETKVKAALSLYPTPIDFYTIGINLDGSPADLYLLDDMRQPPYINSSLSAYEAASDQSGLQQIYNNIASLVAC